MAICAALWCVYAYRPLFRQQRNEQVLWIVLAGLLVYGIHRVTIGMWWHLIFHEQVLQRRVPSYRIFLWLTLAVLLMAWSITVYLIMSVVRAIRFRRTREYSQFIKLSGAVLLMIMASLVSIYIMPSQTYAQYGEKHWRHYRPWGRTWYLYKNIPAMYDKHAWILNERRGFIKYDATPTKLKYLGLTTAKKRAAFVRGSDLRAEATNKK